MDFAENFNFTSQHAVQANYFKQNQCSVFTTVCYFNDNGNRHKKPIENIAIISDNKDHTTGQVALYVKKINEYLSAKYPNIEYIHYFTAMASAALSNLYKYINVKE